MSNPTPDELFTGKQYDAARAIQAGDAGRFRDLMIEKGVKHPPESANEVRERAERQGFGEVPQSLRGLRY